MTLPGLAPSGYHSAPSRLGSETLPMRGRGGRCDTHAMLRKSVCMASAASDDDISSSLDCPINTCWEPHTRYDLHSTGTAAHPAAGSGGVRRQWEFACCSWQLLPSSVPWFSKRGPPHTAACSLHPCCHLPLLKASCQVRCQGSACLVQCLQHIQQLQLRSCSMACNFGTCLPIVHTTSHDQHNSPDVRCAAAVDYDSQQGRR